MASTLNISLAIALVGPTGGPGGYLYSVTPQPLENLVLPTATDGYGALTLTVPVGSTIPGASFATYEYVGATGYMYMQNVSANGAVVTWYVKENTSGNWVQMGSFNPGDLSIIPNRNTPGTYGFVSPTSAASMSVWFGPN
jgi:hypothetical protein